MQRTQQFCAVNLLKIQWLLGRNAIWTEADGDWVLRTLFCFRYVPSSQLDISFMKTVARWCSLQPLASNSYYLPFPFICMVSVSGMHATTIARCHPRCKQYKQQHLQLKLFVCYANIHTSTNIHIHACTYICALVQINRAAQHLTARVGVCFMTAISLPPFRFEFQFPQCNFDTDEWLTDWRAEAAFVGLCWRIIILDPRCSQCCWVEM